MRRSLWTLGGVLAVGCGLELSLAPSDAGERDGGTSSSSGSTPSTSSGNTTSGSSSSGPIDAASDAEGEPADASDDADPDAAECQPLVLLNEAFCGNQTSCTRAENQGQVVALPTDPMQVNVGCGSSTINGGHIQVEPTLPSTFHISTRFVVKKGQAPIVVLLLGANAPSSLNGSACESLQSGDIVAAVYREGADAGAAWKLDLRPKSNCQLPSEQTVLDPAPNDTQIDLDVVYDGATLTASGTWADGAAGDLASAPLSATLSNSARVALAAFTLDNSGGSRRSVTTNKLHVLCH